MWLFLLLLPEIFKTDPMVWYGMIFVSYCRPSFKHKAQIQLSVIANVKCLAMSFSKTLKPPTNRRAVAVEEKARQNNSLGRKEVTCQPLHRIILNS